jgi:hypothetical protein
VNSPAPEFEERNLMQHLLGLLPEADQERLDSLSVSDDTVAARLCDAENDLVDAYVRGDLAGEDLDRFMTHYLTSERRRRKVLFAESLLKLEKERKRVTPLPLVPPRAAVTKRPAGRTRWIAWAAVIVVSVAAGTVVFDDLHVRQSLSGITAALRALEKTERESTDELKIQEARTSALLAQVSRLEGVVTNLESASGTVVNAKPLLVRVASFLLSAPTRGIEAPPVLTVPSDVEQLSVRLKLEETEFARYRVSLKSPAGQTVLWQSPRLAPERGQHGAVLKLNLPAERVKNGAYRFDVVGLEQGQEEPVASYAFNAHREE